MLISFKTEAAGALCTLLLLTHAALGAPYGSLERRAPARSTYHNYRRRDLRIKTLDGSQVQPFLVNLLDQYEVTQKGVEAATKGTELYDNLLQHMEDVKGDLLAAIDGVGTLVSVQPAPTPTTAQSSTAVPSETSTESPAKDPAVTIIPQDNPEIVVVASGGQTTTITLSPGATASPRASSTREPSPGPTDSPGDGDGDGDIPDGEDSEDVPEGIPRSASSDSEVAPTPTRTAQAAQLSTKPMSDARRSLPSTLSALMIPAALIATLMSFT